MFVVGLLAAEEPAGGSLRRRLKYAVGREGYATKIR